MNTYPATVVEKDGHIVINCNDCPLADLIVTMELPQLNCINMEIDAVTREHRDGEHRVLGCRHFKKILWNVFAR